MLFPLTFHESPDHREGTVGDAERRMSHKTLRADSVEPGSGRGVVDRNHLVTVALAERIPPERERPFGGPVDAGEHDVDDSDRTVVVPNREHTPDPIPVAAKGAEAQTFRVVFLGSCNLPGDRSRDRHMLNHRPIDVLTGLIVVVVSVDPSVRTRPLSALLARWFGVGVLHKLNLGDPRADVVCINLYHAHACHYTVAGAGSALGNSCESS